MSLETIKIIIATPHKRYDEIVNQISRIENVDVLRIENLNNLELKKISKFNPRYIFFPHWSWKIPSSIYLNFECVIFHMTDLPYGRGGSPLQNLIIHGHKNTKVSAIKCVKEIDAGPIYLKNKLSLSGNAEQIFNRLSKVIKKMIINIIDHRPNPKDQIGEIVSFKRRNPQDSDIGELDDLNLIYDYIRMLDAEGYPNAYIKLGNLKYELSSSKITSEGIVAKVIIKKIHGA